MKLHIIKTGQFKLDGGAMFGVVPKTMWQKLNPADDNNLCSWQLRCLLIEDGNKKILIDTGIGNKQDDKFRSHFHPHNEIEIEVSLNKIGLSTEDITDVLLTHFHFDHVGGALVKDAREKVVPQFPNAKYWTNKVHYDWAYNSNPREAASFIKENFVPLNDMGLLHFIDVEEDIKFSDSIQLSFVNGHTEAMMIPYIKLPSGNTLIYCADLIPSHHHVHLPFIMAYDMKPLDVLKEKQKLHDIATDNKHFLFFEHDLNIACGSIKRNERGRVIFDKEINLQSIL